MMEKFIGTKVILAKPMTKKEYCEYRGWEVPENENPDEEVYLVEYPEDENSKPNHLDHKGYISMSPKHVFDKSYHKISDLIDLNEKSFGEHQNLVVEEYIQLSKKVEVLNKFILGDIFPNVNEDEQDKLKKQYGAMFAYLNILIDRINNF